MSFTFKDLLRKVFGNKADGNKAEPEDHNVEIDRRALTIAVIEDFETKKRTGSAIADMWDNIADLMIEGLGPQEDMSDKETEYVETIRSIAQIILKTNTFSDTVSIPQNHIDTLLRGRHMVYDAKEKIKEKTSELPQGAKGQPYIAEDESGEEQVYFPRSEFEQAIYDRQNQLALFAFKLDDTFARHRSPRANSDEYTLQ